MAEMHPSMARLYRAAAPSGVTTQAELARLLNTSSQRINNWEARGISQQGAIDAERAFGVSPLWVLEGVEREATGRLSTDLPTAAAQGVRPDFDRMAAAVFLLREYLSLTPFDKELLFDPRMLEMAYEGVEYAGTATEPSNVIDFAKYMNRRMEETGVPVRQNQAQAARAGTG